MIDIDGPLYRLERGVRCACSNVHNVTGARGRAGETSRFPHLAPGESVTVAEIDGPAVITRLWLTFDWPGVHAYDGAMLRNRSVRLDITWDGADTPAVSVPVGDFFCHPLCYDLPFENALFASPEGRSLLCVIPMPFRTGARIRICNEFDRRITVFHDIRFVQGVDVAPDDGYLHACFRRTLPTAPGLTHEILPRVRGRGRYLGTHLGVVTDRFNPLHWHGQNLKFYFDGDDRYPSLMGASLDDFGGASWAFARTYMHQDSGLLVSRVFPLGGGHYGFYFYHRRDPFHFAESCAVTVRPMVDCSGEALLAALTDHPGLAGRLALPQPVEQIRRRVAAGEDVWVECGRQDDLCSVALYYLDRPGGDHALGSRQERCTPAWQWPAPDANLLLGDQP
jgi:hypothetical protein